MNVLPHLDKSITYTASRFRMSISKILYAEDAQFDHDIKIIKQLFSLCFYTKITLMGKCEQESQTWDGQDNVFRSI